MLLNCTEPGCFRKFRRYSGMRKQLCPVCAAYERGRVIAEEKRERAALADETNGRAAIHAARGALVAEFIRSGK